MANPEPADEDRSPPPPSGEETGEGAPPARSRDPFWAVVARAVLRESRAVWLLALCMFLVALQPFVLTPGRRAGDAHRPRNTVSDTSAKARGTGDGLPDPLRVIRAKPYLIMGVAAVFGLGMIAGLGLLGAHCLSARARSALDLGRVRPRPPSAFTWLDIAVAVSVLASCAPLVSWLCSQVIYRLCAETASAAAPAWARGLALVCTSLTASGLAVGAAIWLAWRRRGSWGVAAVWPFWPTPRAGGVGALVADLELGGAAYVLCAGWLLALNAVNILVLKTWSLPPDTNPLMGGWLSADTPLAVTLLLVLASVGPAVVEELLFRGVLYNVVRRHFGRTWSAVLVALVFASMHQVLSNFLALIALSLLLTWVYERTGRLLPAIMLHFLNNAVALLLAKAIMG